MSDPLKNEKLSSTSPSSDTKSWSRFLCSDAARFEQPFEFTVAGHQVVLAQRDIKGSGRTGFTVWDSVGIKIFS
jgi:hypothetical protein